jgi:hypothetical protein
VNFVSIGEEFDFSMRQADDQAAIQKADRRRDGALLAYCGFHAVGSFEIVRPGKAVRDHG